MKKGNQIITIKSGEKRINAIFKLPEGMDGQEWQLFQKNHKETISNAEEEIDGTTTILDAKTGTIINTIRPKIKHDEDLLDHEIVADEDLTVKQAYDNQNHTENSI